MADILEVDNFISLGLRGDPGEGYGRPRPRKVRPRPRPRSPEQIKDVAQVMGIPAGELSPLVHEALSLMMAEMDGLRHELEVSHKHDEYIYQLADSHPLMPVYNRRAFRRELTKAAAHVKRTETPSSLLILDIAEGRRAKMRDGARVRDAVMLRAAEIVKEDLDAIDVLGGLGGDSLGVILNVVAEDAAREKGCRLAGMLGGDPVIRQGQQSIPPLAWGAAAIGPGEDAEFLLDKADQDLRQA